MTWCQPLEPVIEYIPVLAGAAMDVGVPTWETLGHHAVVRENGRACGKDVRPAVTVQRERTTTLLWRQCSNCGYCAPELRSFGFSQGKLEGREVTAFPLFLLLGDSLNLGVISPFEC